MARLRTFLAVLLLALSLAASAHAVTWFFGPKGASNGISSQNVAAISLTNSSFLGGTSAVVGSAVTTMSPTSPPFSGTLAFGSAVGCPGTNNGDFTLVGTQISTSGVQPPGTYAICLVATQSGVGNSPFYQALTITGTQQTISSLTLSNTSVTSGAASGTVVGAISVALSPASPTFSGTLAISGPDASNFTLSSSSLPSNLLTSGVLTTTSCTTGDGHCQITITATQSDAIGSPFSQSFTIIVNAVTQTISSVSLTGTTVLSGQPSGTTVGPVSVVMSPSTPAFTGTLSLTGTDAASFALSSTHLPANVTTASSLTTASCHLGNGTCNINIVATQSGATGSPFTQPETITVTSSQPSVLVAVLSNVGFTANSASGTVVGSIIPYLSNGASFSGSAALSTSSNCPAYPGDSANADFSVSGTAPNQSIALASSSLAIGSYPICLAITQSGASNSPFYVSIMLSAIDTTLPAGCVAGQPCVENVTQNVVYTNSTVCSTTVCTQYNGKTVGPFQPLRVATLNANPGDTIGLWPVSGGYTYSEGDVPVQISNLVITCEGTWPTPASDGQCINDPFGTIFDGGSPYGNGTLYGDFRVGAGVGLSINLTINGLTLRNAAVNGRPQTGNGTASASSSTGNSVTVASAANLSVGDYFWNFTAPHSIPGAWAKITNIAGNVLTIAPVGGGTASGVTATLNWTHGATTATSGSNVTVSSTLNLVANDWVYDVTNPAAIPPVSSTPGANGNQTQISNISGNVLTLTSSSTHIAAGDILTFSPAANVGYCYGILVPPGQISQCPSGGNAAGIRIQGMGLPGLICNNCAMYHDNDGLLTTPFFYGSGGSKCINCIISNNGAGDGQSHDWYCGSGSFQCWMIDSIMLDAHAGEALKVRGYTNLVLGNIMGDSDALATALTNKGYTGWIGSSPVGGTPALQNQASPRTNPGWGSANEINNPDGGAANLVNNILGKSQTFQSNNAAIEDGALVPPYASSNWNEVNSTYYNTVTSPTGGQYVWDPAASIISQMTITNLSIIGQPPSYAIDGLGTLVNATLNGSPWSGCDVGSISCPINFQTLSQGTAGLPPSYDYRCVTDPSGCHTPQSITNPSGSTVIALGGSALLTVNNANNLSLNVYAGPGGCNCTNTHGGSMAWLDQAGGAPSTYTQSGFPISAYTISDGDTVNMTTNGNAEGYIGMTGRNQTINDCNNGTLTTGSAEPPECGSVFYNASSGYLPTGVENRQFTLGAITACFTGCNISVTGTYIADSLSQDEYYGDQANGASPGPATVMMNQTFWNTAAGKLTTSELVQINVTGCAFAIGYNNFSDFSDPTCTGFAFVNSGPAKANYTNSTFDLGASSEMTFGSAAIDIAQSNGFLFPGIVVGSGADYVNPNAGPLLINVVPSSMTGIHGGYAGDIMPQHLAGGAIYLGTPTMAQLSNTPIIMVGPMSVAQCTGSSNATETLGGTLAAGDVVTITFSGSVSASISYTLVTGDTLASVSTQLADAINDNATLTSATVFAFVSSAAGISIYWPSTLTPPTIGQSATGSMTITQGSASNQTLTATDGIASDTTLIAGFACANLNTTPPSGSQDGTLTAPATASGTHGTTISLATTWVDTWFSGTIPGLWGPGEGFVMVCAHVGTILFNGSSTPAGPSTSGCTSGYTGITAAGRASDLISALAGLQETLGAAGSDTVTIDTWNSGGKHLSASIAVTSH